ncbi:hypothetical protein IU460_02475 [Nocardia farcinica]|nr:hypothetical protein [Nocardia farcinica]
MIVQTDPRAPRVVLVGPPGAGKSTIGRKLAKELGVDLYDTDAGIERETGRTIPEIFAADGEPEFRRIEERVVRRAILAERGVVSLGGGAVLSANTRALLRNRTVVYLEISVAEGLRRTGASNQRPLLNGDDPGAKYRELMRTRRPLYREVATVRVRTDGRSPSRVVRMILTKLGIDPVVPATEPEPAENTVSPAAPNSRAGSRSRARRRARARAAARRRAAAEGGTPDPDAPSSAAAGQVVDGSGSLTPAATTAPDPTPPPTRSAARDAAAPAADSPTADRPAAPTPGSSPDSTASATATPTEAPGADQDSTRDARHHASTPGRAPVRRRPRRRRGRSTDPTSTDRRDRVTTSDAPPADETTDTAASTPGRPDRSLDRPRARRSGDRTRHAAPRSTRAPADRPANDAATGPGPDGPDAHIPQHDGADPRELSAPRSPSSADEKPSTATSSAPRSGAGGSTSTGGRSRRARARRARGRAPKQARTESEQQS